MGKKSATTSTKSKNKSASSVKIHDESLLKYPQISEDENENFPQISISLESYQYIQSVYPSSQVFATCQFHNKDLGRTEKILLTDDPVNVIDHSFKFRCNTELSAEIDKLTSYPVLITVFETPFTEPELRALSTEISVEGNLKLQKSELSINSVISLYEALTGDVVEFKEPATPKKTKAKKDKKQMKASGSKMSKSSSKDSKNSKKSGGKKKDKKLSKKSSKESTVEKGDTIVGCCVVDLLPLVLGKESYTEFVPIILAETFCDDRMATYKFKAGLVITVEIDKPIVFDCGPQVLHITFESIYNTPSIMNEEMEYHLCLMVPLVDSSKQPLVVTNGDYIIETSQLEQRKFWPYIPKNKYNQTLYMLDQNEDFIKNYVDSVNMSGVFAKPRIEFNCIKRNILSKNGFLAFYDYVKKYQKIVIELYAFKKTNTLASGSQSLRTPRSDLEMRKSKSSYLHLMAVVDLSPLLYPGTTKIRLAVPLSTFQHEEAASAGLEKSYFFPPAPKDANLSAPSTSRTATGKKGKGKKDSKKGSKKDKSSGKSSKDSKKKKGKGKGKEAGNEDLNMKNALPTEPVPEPPPEPSVKVFNEKGERTFIIVELELSEPLIKKQKMEDLHRNLQDLVHQKSFVPKIVLNNNVVMEYYQNVMKAVIVDINEKYATYLQEKKQCHCYKKADFLTYLRRIGSYQNFVSALIQVATLLSQNKLNVIDETNKEQQYQKLIEEIFIYLNSEINRVLHGLSVRQTTTKSSKNTAETVLFYAKEAVEMGNLVLAERYYLESLYHGSKNAHYWYKYAVYKMESNDSDKAFMCLQEGLKREMFHKYSLLMNGIFLTEKKHMKEAEMCLLTLMVREPRWVEGWVVLFFFYKIVDNVGGMDMAQEMALKYLDTPYTVSLDEDLAWSSQICPNTIFFRTACTLINIRMYSWAENALSYELKNPGVVHYMLAVICYYRKNFNHALQHLQKAKQFHGLDFSVASLTGHCFLALGNFEEANYYYRYILSSYEKSDYNHLMYVNCAKTTGDLQEARKLFLIACKNCPTPFTWMSCGSVYFQLNDLISAEECFSEAVILDNTIPECWGYLALINLTLRRCSEAEICYNLALKNNLRDEFLLQEIRNQFQKMK